MDGARVRKPERIQTRTAVSATLGLMAAAFFLLCPSVESAEWEGRVQISPV